MLYWKTPKCFALYRTALLRQTNKGFADTVHVAWGGWQSAKSGPRAGRVAAHPWMTRPTRPEGTDNGQSLLTLSLCQNVSTFNNATSAPYMVKQTWNRIWCELAPDGAGVGGRADHAALNPWPKALSSSTSPVGCLSSLIHHISNDPFIWAFLIINWLIVLISRWNFHLIRFK